MRIFGRSPAVVIVSDFTDPPDALPIPYREVIAATLLRRGLRLVAFPVGMWLDAEIPVELGHLHYSMPKHYDPDLQVRLEARALHITGRPSAKGAPLGRLTQILSLPLSLAFGLGVRAFTRFAPVVGTADLPIRSARIALAPKGLGTPLRISECHIAGASMSTFWCQVYTGSRTHLGPPQLF